jgi:mannose-1-phosphate guanylyltransferase
LLEWTLEKLAKEGAEEVVLATSYRTEPFLRQCRTQKHGIKLTYSRDPLGKPLGTAGPIKKAERLIGREASFLVLNEDIFSEVSYAQLLKKLETKKAVAVIALHRVQDPSRFGVAELTRDDRINQFVEKPLLKDAPSNLINAGIYALSQEVFDYIPKGRMVSMEREVFPRLAQEGNLHGMIFNSLWMDIGKIEDYLELNKILLDSSPNIQKYNSTITGEIKEPVALDKGVIIGEKSVVGPYTTLGRKVTIGNNANIRNSVVFPETTISNSVSIHGAVIGEGVVVGENASIGKGCVVGDNVKISDRVKIPDGMMICYGKEITEHQPKPRTIC